VAKHWVFVTICDKAPVRIVQPVGKVTGLGK